MTAAQMLAMGGFPDTPEGREAFYNEFPDESTFMARYGGHMAMGGLTNKVAFPQQPVENKFYSEGFRPSVPFGFYQDGGLTNEVAFPQQPVADKFYNSGWKPNVPFGFYEEGGLTNEIAFPQQPVDAWIHARTPYVPSYNVGGALPGGANEMPCFQCGGRMQDGGSANSGTQYGGFVGMDAPLTMRMGGTKKKLSKKKAGGKVDGIDQEEYISGLTNTVITTIQDNVTPFLYKAAEEKMNNMQGNDVDPTYAQYGVSTGYSNPYFDQADTSFQPYNLQNQANRKMMNNELKQYDKIADTASNNFFTGLGNKVIEKATDLFAPTAAYGGRLKKFQGDIGGSQVDTKADFEAYMKRIQDEAKKAYYERDPSQTDLGANFYVNPSTGQVTRTAATPSVNQDDAFRKYFTEYMDRRFGAAPNYQQTNNYGYPGYNYNVKFSGNRNERKNLQDFFAKNNFLDTQLKAIDVQNRTGLARFLGMKDPKRFRLEFSSNPGTVQNRLGQIERVPYRETKTVDQVNQSAVDSAPYTGMGSLNYSAPIDRSKVSIKFGNPELTPVPTLGYPTLPMPKQDNLQIINTKYPKVKRNKNFNPDIEQAKQFWDLREPSPRDQEIQNQFINEFMPNYGRPYVGEEFIRTSEGTQFMPKQIPGWGTPESWSDDYKSPNQFPSSSSIQDRVNNVFGNTNIDDFFTVDNLDLKTLSGLPGAYKGKTPDQIKEMLKNDPDEVGRLFEIGLGVKGKKYGGLPKAQLGLDSLSTTSAFDTNPWSVDNPSTVYNTASSVYGEPETYTIDPNQVVTDPLSGTSPNQKNIGVDIKKRKQIDTGNIARKAMNYMRALTAIGNIDDTEALREKVDQSYNADKVFGSVPANIVGIGDYGVGPGQQYGMFRPPFTGQVVQKPGIQSYNASYGGSYEFGGMYEEGGEYYLDQKQIADILANGGTIEYLD
jgi:hypothetical protein